MRNVEGNETQQKAELFLEVGNEVLLRKRLLVVRGEITLQLPLEKRHVDNVTLKSLEILGKYSH